MTGKSSSADIELFRKMGRSATITWLFRRVHTPTLETRPMRKCVYPSRGLQDGVNTANLGYNRNRIPVDSIGVQPYLTAVVVLCCLPRRCRVRDAIRVDRCYTQR